MSTSPAPVLDFFFDCVPPPKTSYEYTDMYIQNKKYKLHDNEYSQLSKDFINNDHDIFDELANKKIQPRFELGTYPQLSKKVLDLIEEFNYTGLMLNSPWTLWVNRFVPNLSKEEFEINLRNIYTISTIKTFWNVFNHMPLPSLVKPQYSYHLMRDNIRPVWEDETNANGGMWKLRCPKKYTDRVWQELLLACVGEQFLEDVNRDDEILGLSVSVRKNDDLIQVWNLNADGAEDCGVIKKINEICPFVRFETSFYKPHHTYWSKNKSV